MVSTCSWTAVRNSSCAPFTALRKSRIERPSDAPSDASFDGPKIMSAITNKMKSFSGLSNIEHLKRAAGRMRIVAGVPRFFGVIVPYGRRRPEDPARFYLAGERRPVTEAVRDVRRRREREVAGARGEIAAIA